MVLHILQLPTGYIRKAVLDTALSHVCQSISCNSSVLHHPAGCATDVHASACRWGSQTGAYLLNWVDGINGVTYNVNLLAYAGDGVGETVTLLSRPVGLLYQHPCNLCP